ALDLAPADRQRFHLTDGSATLFRVVFSNKDRDVLRELPPGLILLLRAIRSVNPSFPLEMTLHANAVAALTSQLTRIDHGAHTSYVIAAAPMAALAPHPVLQEGLGSEPVERTLQGWLDAARVAEQARRI